MSGRTAQFIERAGWSAGLALALSWSLPVQPWGGGLTRASYDLLQLFPRDSADSRVSIITLPIPSDRLAHAALLEYLGKDGARLVVSDIVLAEPGKSQDDQSLATAIRSNGRVVLAGEYRSLPKTETVSRDQSNPPLPQFATNALDWGLAAVQTDIDGIVRWIWPGTDVKESLPWTAARHAGSVRTSVPHAPTDGIDVVRYWLRYYGPPQAIPHWDADDATNQVPGRFKDQVVFLGAGQSVGRSGDVKDTFATPYTSQTGLWSGGAEILATSFLNIVNGQALHTVSAATAFLIALMASLALAALFSGLCGWHLVWMVPCVAVVVPAGALVVFWNSQVWFNWTGILFVQLPASLAGAWLAPRVGHMWTAIHPLPGRARRTKVTSDPEAGGTAPIIPDHQMLRPIGSGSYGQVWLARNRVGLFHAVKIVSRRRFQDDRPYEREFAGIQQFMPVSRSHRGLVHVLHVGRDDAQGFFFYIMEAGDDERTGTLVAEADYRPDTLGRRIAQRRRLPASEVLGLMIDLCDAIGFLHQQGLVHRDIKPSNIIYVAGVPKLADIGLVAVAGRDKDASLVGTPGYLLVDAAGTVHADLYALGKVLYVALTGFDPARFPEAPTVVDGAPEDPLSLGLMDIAWRACSIEGTGAYADAAQLGAALVSLRLRHPESEIATRIETS